MWSNKYIGIPYKVHGRDINGIDCWGLVRLIYSEQFGIDLPSFSADYSESDTVRIQELIAQYKEGWEQLDKPQEGCVVLLRVLGTESHVGVAINDKQFLHAKSNCVSSVENFNSVSWKNRIIGYFKYSEKSSAVLNVVPHPLRTDRYTVPVPPNTTLEQLADWIVKEYKVAPELKSKITILVNTKVISQEQWATTVLSESDTVEYRAVPRDGDTLRMAAIIAIAIYAPEIVAYMGDYETVAAAQAGMGTTAYNAAVIGVSMTGAMLVNAIAPIRPPATPADPGATIGQLMVTGNANQANPYGGIPVVLGKVKLTPPLGANNFITYQNERDTYLTMLLAWGYGPLDIDASTLKIGDVAMSDFTLSKFSDGSDMLVTLDRKTEPTSNELYRFNSIYGNDVFQVTKSLTLICDGNPEGTTTPIYTTVTDEYGNSYQQQTGSSTAYPEPGPWSEAASNTECDKFTVAFHFPQGLRKIKIKGDGAGESSPTPVDLELQVKFDSASAWTPWKVLRVGGDAAKKDAFTVSESFDVGNRFAQVRVRRLTGDNTEDNPDWRYNHESVFLSATFVKNSAPTKDPKNCKIAKTAIQVKANDQLNGQIEGINAVVQTWCLSWNGSAWVEAATNNPADLMRYVLQHPANPQRVLDEDVSSKINLVDLQYWHDYCVRKGFTFNSVMATQRSVLETIRDICAAGRASPALVDGMWTVVIDEPKPNIIQHFSPHNSWGFEATKVLPKLPDGLRVTYYDENQNYQQAEIIVYAVGKSQDNSELFEAISLPGVTRASQVEDHARWHMAQAQLRREVYTINTDIEYIVCNRGDRVKVMHDVPMWGLGSGRIKQRVTDTIFDLDELVPMQYTGEYTTRIRSATGNSVERQVKKQFNISKVKRTSNVVTVTLTARHPIKIGDSVRVASSNATINNVAAIVTEVTDTTFKYEYRGAAVALATATGTVSLNDGYYSRVEFIEAVLPADAEPADLFLFGELHQEAQDLIIMSVEPTTNKSARITLVDYGVTDTYNIFNDYLNLTAADIFETQITLPPKLLLNSFKSNEVPIISSIISDDTVVDVISPGTYSYKIKVSYANSATLPTSVDKVECQYGYSNSTDSAGYRSIYVNYLANSIEIPNVMSTESYKLRLRYCAKDGRTGPWTGWSVHSVSGKMNNPNNVTSISVKRTGRYLNVIPSMTIIPDDFKHYEVRVYKDAGSGDFWSSTDPKIKKVTTTSIASIDLKDFDEHRISASGINYRIACRVVDSVGNYSNTSMLTNIVLYTIAP